NTKQRQAIPQHSHNECPDESAENSALASDQTCAANHYCGYRIKLIHDSGDRLRGIQTCSEDNSRKAAQPATQSVDQSSVEPNVDARENRCFLVPADSIRVPAQFRSGQDEVGDQIDRKHYYNRRGYSQHLSYCDLPEAV